MFKAFGKIRKGVPVSLSRETITCRGGKLYTGFDEMIPMIPQFVSIKERYKQTPEAVLNFINSLEIVRTEKISQLYTYRSGNRYQSGGRSHLYNYPRHAGRINYLGLV